MSIRSIYIADSYADELREVLEDARRSHMEAGARLRSLEHEIANARRVPFHQIPNEFVALYSRVRLRISNPTLETTIQLVLPAEADAAAHRVSILSPVAAILGYRVGEEVDIDLAGRRRRIRILSVIHPLPPRPVFTAGRSTLTPARSNQTEGIYHDQLNALKPTDLHFPHARPHPAPRHSPNHGVPPPECSRPDPRIASRDPCLSTER